MAEPLGPQTDLGTAVTTVPADALDHPRRMPSVWRPFHETFAALKHRNYRLFFMGQIVSVTGTWMQFVAESWLVYELTHSAFALGLIRFLHTVPITVFSLFAGTIADRFPKRTILIVTQSCSMLLSLLLFALTRSGHIALWQVGLIALGLGLANAFDIPTRQSFVVEMVGKPDLMNAIALNSSTFNTARVIGPAIAGVLIQVLGVSVCFLANAISFGAVILGYAWMRLDSAPRAAPMPNLRQAMREAGRFVRTTRDIRTVMVLVAVVSVFGMPYAALLPVFAAEVFHAGATGYGWLLSANGIGALGGSITLAAFGGRLRKERLLVAGIVGFSAVLFAFANQSLFLLGAGCILVSGWFMIVFFATANTFVQIQTPDALRGRVMGIYLLCFIGLAPLGSFLAGVTAKLFSAPITVALGAALCLAGGLFFALPRLWTRIAEPPLPHG